MNSKKMLILLMCIIIITIGNVSIEIGYTTIGFIINGGLIGWLVGSLDIK